MNLINMDKLNFEAFSKIITHLKESSMFKSSGFSEYPSLVNVDFIAPDLIKFSAENRSDEGFVIESYSIVYMFSYSAFKVLNEQYSFSPCNDLIHD